jgi:anti-anti-sigma factor
VNAPDQPSIELVLDPARTRGYAAIVTLHGEHDLATSADLADALARIGGTVLVDLSSCDFIDSTILGVIIRKAAELRREGFRIDLLVPDGNSPIRRIVEVTGIASLVTVFAELPAPE